MAGKISGAVDRGSRTSWKAGSLVLGVLFTLGLIHWARTDPQGWQNATSAVAQKVVEILPAVLDAIGRMIVALLNAITSALPPPSGGGAG